LEAKAMGRWEMFFLVSVHDAWRIKSYGKSASCQAFPPLLSAQMIIQREFKTRSQIKPLQKH
jgi:hypothetical protein